MVYQPIVPFIKFALDLWSTFAHLLLFKYIHFLLSRLPRFPVCGSGALGPPLRDGGGGSLVGLGGLVPGAGGGWACKTRDTRGVPLF